MSQTTLIPTLRFIKVDGLPFSDWERAKFGEVVYRASKKFDPATSTEKYLLIELENLESNTGRVVNVQTTEGQKSIKTHFSSGDVLFGKLRPYLRKFAHVKFDGVCSSEIWVLRSKKVNHHFLYYLIQTNKFLKYANVSSGSKMPRADWEMVASTKILLPNAIEQKKIATFWGQWMRSWGHCGASGHCWLSISAG